MCIATAFWYLEKRNHLSFFLLKNVEFAQKMCLEKKDNIKSVSPVVSLPTTPQGSLNEKMIMYLVSTEHPGEKKSIL